MKNVNISKWVILLFFGFWLIFFITLLFFRDARLDENIYLGDTFFISKLLSQGQWIGNYGVGLHGFLSKFVISIFFIDQYPSVFLASFLNLLLGWVSGIVFFRILNKYFKLSVIWSLLGVSLLFCSYQFITYVPTYYRDLGALFYVLLIIEAILWKRSFLLVGLYLLLLLDFKEHVFYTISPAILLWVGFNSFLPLKEFTYSIIGKMIKDAFVLFLPSLIFLCLMFFTSIIPLNVYNANILGLVEKGITPMASNFETEAATYNRDIDVHDGIVKTMPLIDIPTENGNILWKFAEIFNIFLSYLGKFLYPRTFSYISLPFILVIPALGYSAANFWSSWKKRAARDLFLPLLLWEYTVIYIIHASVARYLIPVTPIFIIFFLLFLFKGFQKKQFITIILTTVLFTLGGLYFEYSYVLVKIIFSLLPILMLILLYYIKKEYLKYLLIGILCVFSLGTALIVSYKNGQIRAFLDYGYNRECETILSYVGTNDRIWINDIGWDKLPFVLRSENIQDPEWRWPIKNWLPKKSLLRRDNNLKTFNFYWKYESQFKEGVTSNGIDTVLYVKLDERLVTPNMLLQDRVDELRKFDWLELKETISLKNKTLYIFKVKK